MNCFKTQLKQIQVTKLATAICILALGLLTACEPSKEKKAQWAEEKRVECLDKFCEGDKPPKPPVGSVIMKFNGQLYLAPKEYFSTGINGASFNWWEHKPVSSSASIPAEMQALYARGKADEVSIVIFLTGRARWPDPAVERPWERETSESYFEEFLKKGYRIERQVIRPELEIVRFYDTSDKPYRHVFYVATQRKRIRGSGPPILGCDPLPSPNLSGHATCTAGEYWQHDVYADFRISASHAQDWPAIHEEIVRVLNLAQKVNP
jgi:hypothetical protein